MMVKQPQLANSTPSVNNQGGAALVVAMLIFAVATALIVALYDDYTLFSRRVSNSLMAEQAHAYLRGAEDLATLVLRQDQSQDRSMGRERDDLTELWAQEATPYGLDEGGWLTGQVQDLQGLFNLNTLLPRASSSGGQQTGQAASYTPAQRQFIRLLQALAEPQLDRYQAIQVTEAIGDWLDGDQLAAANGAEDDHYYGLTPAYRAANRKMASASELRAVAHVTSELYLALKDYITVWPQSGGKLNIHTAPPLLLMSLAGDDELEPLTEAEVESLLQIRSEVGFKDLGDFLSQPVFADRQIIDLRSQLGESSDYFLLSAQVQVADRMSRLYSVLHREERRIGSLARSAGQL